MLTSLSFLQQGQPWPPTAEKERLKRYAQNRQLFEGEHADVYKEQFKRIERVIGNFEDVISYPVIINFQKLLSLKIADLLLGEPPKIASKNKQKNLDEIIQSTAVINTAYEIAIDISRYGTGVFYLYKNDKGKGFMDITQPSCWFPVVQPDNIKKVDYHVLAWTYDVGTDDNKQSFLKMQIHEQGRVTSREHILDRGSIGKQTQADAITTTGFSDFAVIPIHNTITSDRVYGMDDYKDIDSIVSEIEVRVAQISRVLDKHSSPTMTGPSAALVEDENGNFTLAVGNYIPNDAGYDGKLPNVAYVTWDAQMEANFKQIEKLVNFLYMISETGATLLDGDKESGRAESGSALRLRMMSPLAKVNRIRMKFDPALKKALALASEIGWGKIEQTDINITWEDGLPDDEKEKAEIMAIRTGNKSTLSQKGAIKRLDNVSNDEADVILDEIHEDDAMSQPIGLNHSVGGDAVDNNSAG